MQRIKPSLRSTTASLAPTLSFTPSSAFRQLICYYWGPVYDFEKSLVLIIWRRFQALAISTITLPLVASHTILAWLSLRMSRWTFTTPLDAEARCKNSLVYSFRQQMRTKVWGKDKSSLDPTSRGHLKPFHPWSPHAKNPFFPHLPNARPMGQGGGVYERVDEERPLTLKPSCFSKLNLKILFLGKNVNGGKFKTEK